MPFSTLSRYHGLPVYMGHRGQHLAQRIVPPSHTPEGSLYHTLVIGETLELLAKHYYGHEDLWWRIADANPARHPNDWQIGDTLVVPPLSAVRMKRA